jgi:hypothetical protein
MKKNKPPTDKRTKALQQARHDKLKYGKIMGETGFKNSKKQAEAEAVDIDTRLKTKFAPGYKKGGKVKSKKKR